MSTKILALSIECQSWLIVTWFVRIIIYCAPKEFIWFNCNYNQMVCFLKYWKGLVYILVGFWTPRSGFGIPGTVFQPLLIVKAEFRITHFSFLFTVTNGKLISSCGIPDSLSCILDSNAQDSGTTSKVFTDSGIQQAKKKKSRISASRFPHVGSSVSIHSIILLIQISMSAPPLIPFVTSMLIAPILKDPISVPVRPDSLVMAKPAKV